MSRDSKQAEGFTVIELLTVVAIIGILGALLLPSLARAKGLTRRIVCLGNLKQLGIASQLYWDDNEQKVFPYLQSRSNRGTVYWFGWLEKGREGARKLDHTQGALWPYIQGNGIEICPSFDYNHASYKPKSKGASYGYGYNIHLTGNGFPVQLSKQNQKISQVRSHSTTALMADAAQINDFQFPASPQNPLIEEFYYINNTSTDYPNTHFRHQLNANVLFCDGHVANENPVTGSIDKRLPNMNVGKLRKEILVPTLDLVQQ
jgi:prepilin-type processing-associated H-X9-DG protein/prepilin-type N-terminal cleavage/methylation domain-containing protein